MELELLERLDNVIEHGTSCITLCIPPKPDALASSLTKLKSEFAAAENIKSRL